MGEAHNGSLQSGPRAAFLLPIAGQPVDSPRRIYLFFGFLFSARALFADDAPVIPLHVTIISERAEVAVAFTDENIAWIAQNLNEEFKSGGGALQARFEIRERTDLEAARKDAAAACNFFARCGRRNARRQVKWGYIAVTLLHPHFAFALLILYSRAKMTACWPMKQGLPWHRISCRSALHDRHLI